ncbi:MAG: MMPL family transporter [Gaiellaceae bacterium]
MQRSPTPDNGQEKTRILRLGPVGRLGRWSAAHARVVIVGWLLVAVALGFFAPRVEHALSGAGWHANGSESVDARETIEQNFGGLSSSALWVVVDSEELTVDTEEFQATVTRVETVLSAHESVASVALPEPGVSISEDGRTAIVQAGAAGSTTEMVAAADDLKGELRDAGTDNVSVNLTGASGLWSDFNVANRDAMLKSELLSWPVTMAILLLAFGSLVAAGLPLLLTILGLVAAAGSLYIATLAFDVSIWAMNFALMFALALGIDYALFVVHRFRGAFFGESRSASEAVGITMDTAGKAVLFSGVTVLISLSAVMLVPSPAFRSMSLGIMLSVLFVLGATLTLLPAILGKLGPKVDRLALPWVRKGEHRSRRFESWALLLRRRPLLFGGAALALLIVLALPTLGLKTGMPSIAVLPEDAQARQGYNQVQDAFGPGAPGTLQIVAPADEANETAAVLSADSGIASVFPTQLGQSGLALVQAVPTVDPSDPAVGDTIDRLRSALPVSALVGGAAAENHDLEEALSSKTPLVVGVVLVLGFLLLLIALQAPVLAAAGVLTNLLAVGAGFGVAKLIFQDGHGASLLGFESQGFINAWGPVFFFAMIFAISMDYTVFLLSSAKEHFDRTGDAREAMIGGLAHSGRVIFAAAAVMVAVFFTFAISGPLPPKEMGVILGVSVLLDAALIRLVLMPVLLRLLGPAAWAQPRWLSWLPAVRFGHA